MVPQMETSLNPEEAEGRAGRRGAMFLWLLVLLLVWASPFAYIGWQVRQSSKELDAFEEEFKRRVNPDELRAWVMTQLKRHPQGGTVSLGRLDCPSSFPSLRQHELWVFLSRLEEAHPRPGVQGASLFWNYGYLGMKVSVYLNEDGTAANVDFIQPWAKGVTFERISK